MSSIQSQSFYKINPYGHTNHTHPHMPRYPNDIDLCTSRDILHTVQTCWHCDRFSLRNPILIELGSRTAAKPGKWRESQLRQTTSLTTCRKTIFSSYILKIDTSKLVPSASCGPSATATGTYNGYWQVATLQKISCLSFDRRSEVTHSVLTLHELASLFIT